MCMTPALAFLPVVRHDWPVLPGLPLLYGGERRESVCNGSPVLANENVLTHPFLRPGTDPEGEQERRRKALSRSTSTLLAVALHIGFFFFFVFAVHPFDMNSKPIVETFLLMPPPGNNRPQQRPINPQPVFNAAPNIEAPPLYIAKPPPIPPKDQDKTGTSGQPTDILGA